MLVLWRRIFRHGKQKPVVIVAKTLRQKIISDTHGDSMTGHESKNKIKETIISSQWWPGLDTEIEIQIKSCDKCQRTIKGKYHLRKSHYPVFRTKSKNAYELIWTFKNNALGEKVYIGYN
jgi:hypothetical protein